MEETRISRMYLNLFVRWLGALPGRLLGSPVAWIVAGITVLVVTGIAIHAKGRGNLHHMEENLGAMPSSAPSTAAESGGQAPMILSRGQTEGAFTPEFISATLLPGRGLNILQITAFIPGKGQVPLLASPSLEDAAKIMSGAADDGNGQANLAMGAPFELPWAGAIAGSPLPGDVSVLANWMGRSLTLPAVSERGADGGLLLKQRASSIQPSILPDGGVAQATFDTGDFSGRWPSSTQVEATVVLAGHNIDLTVSARNTGTEPEPMGIGWRPHFTLSSADRAQLLLHVPSSTRAETRGGHLTPTAGTPFDFSPVEGKPLGAATLDELYVQLKTASLDAGPETELRYPAAGYGLRLTALSGGIKALHVSAPANQPFLIVDPQTNYDDPLGHQWPQGSPGALIVLKPGESLEWKVRLEIFALHSSGNSGTMPFTPQRMQP